MDKNVILYVEDDAGALETMKIALEDRGYQVLVATNGAEAMTLLKAKTPDIILADLRMQPVNGFELFQQIKKNPRLVKTPVFFLTAVDDPISQKYGESLGVDAYLTKPVDIDNLDSLIRAKLGIK